MTPPLAGWFDTKDECAKATKGIFLPDNKFSTAELQNMEELRDVMRRKRTHKLKL